MYKEDDVVNETQNSIAKEDNVSLEQEASVSPASAKILPQEATQDEQQDQSTPAPESEADDKLAHAIEVTKNLLKKAASDCGAPFETDQLKALAVIKKIYLLTLPEFVQA
jgi:hypothetical protein